MTWAQVTEMAKAGMEFGSHSVSHPILSAIANTNQLRQELEVSKAAIERAVGQSIHALAYPVGGPNAINEQVLTAVAQAGYSVAFTYQSGGNRMETIKPLNFLHGDSTLSFVRQNRIALSLILTLEYGHQHLHRRR